MILEQKVGGDERMWTNQAGKQTEREMLLHKANTTFVNTRAMARALALEYTHN